MNIASGWRSWLCSKIDFDDGVCNCQKMFCNGFCVQKMAEGFKKVGSVNALTNHTQQILEMISTLFCFSFDVAIRSSPNLGFRLLIWSAIYH